LTLEASRGGYCQGKKNWKVGRRGRGGALWAAKLKPPEPDKRLKYLACSPSFLKIVLAFFHECISVGKEKGGINLDN